MQSQYINNNLQNNLQEINTIQGNKIKHSKHSKPPSTGNFDVYSPQSIYNTKSQTAQSFQSKTSDFHNMSIWSWSYPTNVEPGPGTHESISSMGIQPISTKVSAPSQPIGLKTKNDNRYVDKSLVQDLIGKNVPGAEYEITNVNKNKEPEQKIGTDKARDEYLLNPFKGRSPGPIYHISKNLSDLSLHTTKPSIPRENRYKKIINQPASTNYNPDFNNTKLERPRPVITPIPSDTYQHVFSHELERQLINKLGPGPAAYSKLSNYKDIGGNVSIKTRFGKEVKPPSKKIIKMNKPGPHSYDTNRVNGDHPNVRNRGGAINKSKNRVDFRIVGNQSSFLMKTER